MANDTRSSRRSKDDESNSSRNKPVNGKGLSDSVTMDTSGLRRSMRETPSQKQISSSPSTTPSRKQLSPSPSSTQSRKQISPSPSTRRMSERLEIRTATTTSVKRKSEILETKRMPSPLRRSDRGKPLSSLDSKKSKEDSGSSDLTRKKLRTEKSAKPLPLEAREISREEKEQDPKLGVEKKRMDAHTYKSFFKLKLRRDTAPDLNYKLVGSVSKIVDNREDGGEQCSGSRRLREESTVRACEGGKDKERLHCRLRNFDAEALGNHGEVSCSRQKHNFAKEPVEPSEGDNLRASKIGHCVKEALGDDAERVQLGCSAVEKLQTPELVGSVCMGRVLDGDTEEGTGDRKPSKRKWYTVEMDCKASTTLASVDTCTSSGRAVSLPSSECNCDNMVGTCVTCSKRLRGQRIGKKPEFEADEVGKKHSKVVSSSADPASPRSRLKESPRNDGVDSGLPADSGSQLLPGSTDSILQTLPTNHAFSACASYHISPLSEVQMVKSEEGMGSGDVQKNLHDLMEPGISKLCELLKLSEDVKVMARTFLEYIVNNHRVDRDPTTIFQAFQISLCCIAASMLKYKVHTRESLALAKQHMNFGCTEEEVDNVFSMLRQLKKIFLHRVEKFRDLELSKDSVSTTEYIMKEFPDARMFQSVASSQQNVKAEIDGRPENQECDTNLPTPQQEQATKHKVKEKRLPKSIKRIQKKCDKRMIKLILKQQLVETQEFFKTWDKKKVQLEKDYRLDLALVRSVHANVAVRSEKLKRLEDEFTKKLEEHELQKSTQNKELKAKQLAARNEERQKAEHWLKVAKSLAQPELSCELPSHESEFVGTDKHRVHDDPENVPSVSGGLVEEQCPNRKQVSDMTPFDIPRTDTPTTLVHPNHETEALDSMLNVYSSADASENNVFVNPDSSGQGPDGAPSSTQEVPESAMIELVRGAEVVDIVNPEVESNGEHNGRDDVDASVLDLMAVQNDAACSSINGGSLSEELAPLVQPVANPAQGGALPQNLALQGECFRSSTSTEVYDVDAQASGNQNVLLEVEVLPSHSADTGPNDQPNHAESSIEGVEQLHLVLSTDSLVDPNEPDSHLASGVEQLHLALSTDSPVDPNEPDSLAASGVKQLHLVLSTDSPVDPNDEPDSHAASGVEQLHLALSTDSPVDHNEPDSHATSGVEQLPSARPTSYQSLAAHSAETSNQEVTQPMVNLVPPPLVHAQVVPSGQNQSDLDLAVEIDYSLSSEGRTSSPNAEASSQLVEDTTEILDQVSPGAQMGMHSPVDIPLGEVGVHFPSPSALLMASQMLAQPLYADPLQNELERLRKENEHATKVHEEMKQRLKSDCQKEVEERIAEIRRKYEARFHEAEAEFLVKKTELHTNHNKVLMNKMLADAFRYKCLGNMRMQQGASFNFKQRPAPGPSSVTGLAADVPAAATQQTIAPPPVHVVRQSAPLISSITCRPPLISPITPSTRNRQAAGEIRAPAPHLQPYRPSSSVAATSIPSLPSGSPIQSLLSSSPSVPQVSPRPPSPPSPPPPAATHQPASATSIPLLQQVLPIQRNPPTPSVPQVSPHPPPPPPPGHFDRAGQQAARNLLQDRTSTSLLFQPMFASYNLLPPLPDFGPGFGSLEESQLGAAGTRGSGIANITGSGVATDIVCLSDDD